MTAISSFAKLTAAKSAFGSDRSIFSTDAPNPDVNASATFYVPPVGLKTICTTRITIPPVKFNATSILIRARCNVNVYKSNLLHYYIE